MNAPSPSPTCRLTAAHVGDRDGWHAATRPVAFGPELAAPPALASDGDTLVVVGTAAADGLLRIWAGSPGQLEEMCVVGERHQPVAVTRAHGRWHLFGTDHLERPCHATSTDLVTWTVDHAFPLEHPHVILRGAAAADDHVVVLAEVVVQGRSMGWTLLHGAEDRVTIGDFRAREITFPLTAGHRVVGPAHVRDDEIALAITSATTQMVARTVPGTHGRSWTLGLLSPPVHPTVALARGRQVCVAGDDLLSGSPLLVVSDGHDVRLDARDGAVCAATFHGDVLILARMPSIPDADLDGQSSPAYISSISLA